MTPRERIKTALNHQTPDRTPTDGWFHHEVTEKLKKHYRTDDWNAVLTDLGIEGWAELSPDLVPAEKADRMAASKSTHASGTPAIWIDERTYEDNWGVRFRWGKDGRYHEWLSGPLENAESITDNKGFRMLTTDDIWEPENYGERVALLKEDEHFVYSNLENPYRRFWNLRGLENALADYIINTEFLETVYDSLYPVYTELALRMTRAGVDMIRIVGDIAMQDRIIMGPELWRKYDKPRMAALIGACKSANPDLDVFFHSDGDLTELMDDLVEVGFTVLNPIQPECMDPAEVKRCWGDRLTLHGCVSIQRTLPFGTPDEVREEIETLIRECGHNGGLVLMPSNRIQPDTPVENIIACYHTARDFNLGG